MKSKTLASASLKMKVTLLAGPEGWRIVESVSCNSLPNKPVALNKLIEP